MFLIYTSIQFPLVCTENFGCRGLRPPDPAWPYSAWVSLELHFVSMAQQKAETGLKPPCRAFASPAPHCCTPAASALQFYTESSLSKTIKDAETLRSPC